MPTDNSLLIHRILTPCKSPTDLHAWVQLFCGMNVPRMPVCPGHAAPFDYLCRAYFEPSSDQVVWAPRGGGKTRLAAVATLLDLLHKPGCSVRILGGSLEQSLRMWEHLLPDVERLVLEEVERKVTTARRLSLRNKSSAAVLTQSERAVRGLRVQKLRCDEVELFKPEIWEAAQLVTRSRKPERLAPPPSKRRAASESTAHRVLSLPVLPAHDAKIYMNETAAQYAHRPEISGVIEALSTQHNHHGLMHRIIEQARAAGVPLVHWCLLEVLEKCPPHRACETCALFDDCGGVAKDKCDGFLRIDDAIAMKRRVGRETWDAEMLCRAPSVRGCVFPTFDPAVHVQDDVVARGVAEASRGGVDPARVDPSRVDPSRVDPSPDSDLSLAVDFGFANPFVCLWVRAHADGTVHVIDEYVQEQRVIPDHVEQIRTRGHGAVKRIYCDPAGNGRNDQTAASSVTLLRQAGFTVRHRQTRIVDGLELIRAALRPADLKIPPRLFVHSRCKRLIHALQAYRYPDHGGELPLKDGTHDHLIDALRYYFVNRQTGEATVPRRY